MATTYYAVVTEQGNAKIANAVLMGTKVNITTFAVGTGGGAYYAPTGKEETLIQEKWRGSIEEYGTDTLNENVLKITAIVPSSVGGFTVREMGVFDEEGVLIAIANCPPMEKIVLGDGIVSEFVPTIKIAVSNTAVINFKVDPTAIIAIKADISTAVSDTKTWAKGTFSNRNLLRNSDFKNPINQRGQTSYQNEYGGKYTIDEWFAAFGVTLGLLVDVASTGISLSLQNGSEWGTWGQFIKISPFVIGETMTVSAKIEGSIITETRVLETTTDSSGVLSFYYDTTRSSIVVRFALGGGTGVTEINNIEWAKIEPGSVRTPFIPRLSDEGLTLSKKQLQTISGFFRAYSYNVNTIYFHIPIPVEMRTSPTGEFINIENFIVWSTDRVVQSGFTFSIGSSSPTFVTINATKVGHGLTDGYLVISGASLRLDAGIY
ncbi:MAG: phage tail protein [Lachnospiraceae bacterium]|nr:phage tail protein [Lachnospiraceae bacterium]